MSKRKKSLIKPQSSFPLSELSRICSRSLPYLREQIKKGILKAFKFRGGREWNVYAADWEDYQKGIVLENVISPSVDSARQSLTEHDFIKNKKSSKSK